MDTAIIVALISLVSSVIGGIVSVTVAVINGRYAVKANEIIKANQQIETASGQDSEKTGEQPNDNERKYRRRQKNAMIGFAIFVLIGMIASVALFGKKPPEFDSPEFHRLRGDDYFLMQMLEQAELEYQQATNMEPNEALNHDKLAQTLSAQGEYERALDEHVSATTLAPRVAMFRYNKVITLIRMDLYQDAERELKKVIELESNNAIYHYYLAALLEASEPYPELYKDVTEELKKAVALEPDNAGYHFYYSIKLAVLGEYNEALSQSQEAVKLDENNAAYHVVYALLLYQLGEREKALSELQKAGELGENDAYYYNTLYAALCAIGHKEDGLEALKKAAEIDSKYEEKYQAALSDSYENK